MVRKKCGVGHVLRRRRQKDSTFTNHVKAFTPLNSHVISFWSFAEEYYLEKVRC